MRSGESIAARWGLGHVWLGSILVAAATSFPELVTSVKAISLGAYDMSISNIYGSILFNLAILGVVVLVYPKWQQEKIGGSIKMATFFTVGLLIVTIINAYLPWSGTFLHLGWGTWLILIAYTIYIRSIFKNKITNEGDISQAEPLLKNIILYLVAVAIIFVAGCYCVRAAEKLVLHTGWNEGFVGLLFLALATSLPELVTAFKAARMKSLQLILSIIWGSNIFNLCIISASDFFLPCQTILQATSSTKGLTALLTLLYGLAVPLIFSLGLKGHYFRLKTAGLLVIVSYVLVLMITFYFS